MKHWSHLFIGALCIAPPALAETGDSALREAMATLPAQIFTAPQVDLGYFLDISVQAARGTDAASGLAVLARAPVTQVRPVESLVGAAMSGDLAEWAEKAGAEPAQIRYFAGFGQPPADVAIWGFTDEASASATFDGLSERGFTPLNGLKPIVANGEPMGMDPTKRDMTDPWTGQMGRISVVTRQGAKLLQADRPEAIAPALPGAPSLLDDPAGQTLLAALEGQTAPVAQALFFGPAMGLAGGIDPAIILQAGTAAEAQAAFQAHMASLPEGVPLYGGAVLADLDDAGKTIGLVALAYPDCAMAEAAAQKAASLWPQLVSSDMEQATVTPGHTDAGAAGCAATLTITTPDGNPGSYMMPAYNLYLLNFPPIRIGQ